jgi:hypothetical protein
MISKRMKLSLLSLGGGVGITVVKLLVVDQWNVISPHIYAAWGWVLEFLAKPLAFSLCLFIVVSALMAGVIAFLIVRNRKLAGELSTALAKLSPPIPPLPLLNEDQQEVLIIVARHDDEGMELAKDDVRGYTELSKVACDGALDVLYEEGLINILYGRWGTQVMLQPKGRKYVLDSRSPLAWAPKRA